MRKLFLAFSILFATIAPAFSATGYVSPNGDISKGFVVAYGGGTDHYPRINGLTLQPASMGEAPWATGLQGNGTGTLDIYDMSSLTIFSASQIKIWMWCDSPTLYQHQIKISISTDGTNYTDGSVQTISPTAGWYSGIFNGTFTQGQLDALRVKLTASGSGAGGQGGHPWVEEVYGEITYTPPPNQIFQKVILQGTRVR